MFIISYSYKSKVKIYKISLNLTESSNDVMPVIFKSLQPVTADKSVAAILYQVMINSPTGVALTRKVADRNGVNSNNS